MYTLGWGSAYQYAALKSGAYDVFFDPPKSRSAPNAPQLSWQKLALIARQQFPEMNISLTYPHEAGHAVVIFASKPYGPSAHAVCILDHATGEILEHRTVGQFPILGAWASWNYSLHVGSVLGLTSKILWTIACLVLMLLPVTGFWMWWQRRPEGKSGFPRRPEEVVMPVIVRLPIIVLCFLLPAVGLSLLVIIAGEAACEKLFRGKAAGS